MSSIYIHIPFCRQACFYCDFHFSTSLQAKSAMVEAICKEIILQKDYLPSQHLHTLYWGGGTPSLLSEAEFGQIWDTITQIYTFNTNIEITLEANPDDLTQQHLEMLRKVGVNRLSIGIQSFHPAHLQYLNRIHQAEDAIRSVKLAQDVGFENISIDLIYAVPASHHQIWESDVLQAIDLNVAHISAYCLTIEEKTVLGNWLKKQKIRPIDEDFAAEQFELLVELLEQNRFEQYEISNFARNEAYSKHNSNYWKKGNYLGIGPSAHSYNGYSRQYNLAHNAHYIQAIQKGVVPFEREILTPKDQINEYLLTSLRTKWGTDLAWIAQTYQIRLEEIYSTKLENYLQKDLLYYENNRLTLTRKGKLLADEITAELFVL